MIRDRYKGNDQSERKLRQQEDLGFLEVVHMSIQIPSIGQGQSIESKKIQFGAIALRKEGCVYGESDKQEASLPPLFYTSVHSYVQFYMMTFS